GEKKQEQRRDAGKSRQIKTAQTDLGQFSPASKRQRSNQEAGDGEENLNAILAVPDKRADEVTRQAGGVRDLRDKQTHVDVVHQYEKDGQATEQIHAVNSCARYVG